MDLGEFLRIVALLVCWCIVVAGLFGLVSGWFKSGGGA